MDLLVERWLGEFSASAISPELALANARWIEGETAVAEFLEGTIAQRQRVNSYVTASNRRLMDRYQYLEAGGWIAYGVRLDDSPAEIPYLKPLHPQWNEARQRAIKYLTAPGKEARPLLPDIQPRITGGWREVLASDEPVIFTEGLKTALSPIEQGISAVALRGVTQWHPKGSRELWPELAELCRGRTIAIAFDQDEASGMKSAVAKQARLLGNAIERAGGVPRFITWDSDLGKGLDDVLTGLSPNERRSWLEEALAKALTPKRFRRIETLTAARGILAAPAPTAQQETTGEYLPELPALMPGAIYWLDATMNSGKTYRMGRDWVQPWAEQRASRSFSRRSTLSVSRLAVIGVCLTFTISIPMPIARQLYGQTSATQVA